MTLVDSHCHLNYPGLVEDQPGVVARARAAGVSTMVNIATRQSEWAEVAATADRHDHVFATVGVHPHEADAHTHVTASTLIDAASAPKIVGIGESGLDYHYDRSDRATQRALFREHIAAARATGLPLIVHTRDAEDDTAAILIDEHEKGAFPGLIHCFTASAAFARRVLPLGFSISISGIVTFRKAVELQEIVKSLPLDSLLIETDSPFLAPIPHRGKPCEPSYLTHTAACIAALRGIELDALAIATTRNFTALFRRVPA